MKCIFSALLLVAGLLIAFPTQSFAQNTSDKTVVEIAAGNDDFSTLVTAVKAADLAGTLSGDGPFTVFAPTNAAFDALPDGLIEALVKPKNKKVLQQILSYHVVPGKLMAKDVVAGIQSNNGKLSATTVAGSSFDVMSEMGKVKIKDAQGNVANVTSTDIAGSNGVVHVIDRILLPAGVNPGDLLAKTKMKKDTMLNDKVKMGKMKRDTMLNDKVKKSPMIKDPMLNDRAMKKDTMLKNKAVKGTMKKDTMRKRSAAVNQTSGSVKRTRSVGAAPGGESIAAVATNNGNFKTLVTALGAADLAETFDRPGNYTVFAPTDAAFDALPAGTVAGLVNQKAKLQGILGYHVIPARLTSTQLIEAIKANRNYFRLQTLSGQSLIATMKNGKVMLIDGNGNRSTVVTTDVEADNGIIHAIDTVIMPRSK